MSSLEWVAFDYFHEIFVMMHSDRVATLKMIVIDGVFVPKTVVIMQLCSLAALLVWNVGVVSEG